MKIEFWRDNFGVRLNIEKARHTRHKFSKYP